MINDATLLSQASVSQIAEYLNNGMHNHPVMYCHGGGIVVQTKIGKRRFASDKFQAACKYLAESLDQTAYFPNVIGESED